MINKFFKIINNKNSSVLKFIFFLRYLLLLFLISSILFLNIPKFFNYNKKEKLISEYLQTNYNFEIKDLDSIKYRSFPAPYLEIQNTNLRFNSIETNLFTKTLKIYLNLRSIYNFDNFKVRKIKLIENKISANVDDLKKITQEILRLKKKVEFNNLNIRINRDNKKLISLLDINYKNYGFSKNQINGKIFKKKFKINLKQNFDSIKFKLFETGVSVLINFNDKETKSTNNGTLQAKFFNSNLKSSFNYNNSVIKIENSFFRNKELSFDTKGTIQIKPYFKSNLTYTIHNIEKNLIGKINFYRIFSSKDLIKKINSQNNIIFKSKKFSKNLINNLDLKTNLAFGRLIFSKNFLISESNFQCNGQSNLMEPHPILSFTCDANIKDLKKLLKNFKIKYNDKSKINFLNLKVNGKINVIKNKINFSLIESNNYKASSDDLKYFKTNFESNIINKDFLGIFDIEKIQKFILEIL